MKSVYLSVDLHCVDNHELLEKLRKLGCGVADSQRTLSIVFCPTERTGEIAADILESYGGNVSQIEWERPKLLKTAVDIMKLAGSHAFRRVS